MSSGDKYKKVGVYGDTGTICHEVVREDLSDTKCHFNRSLKVERRDVSLTHQKDSRQEKQQVPKALKWEQAWESHNPAELGVAGMELGGIGGSDGNGGIGSGDSDEGEMQISGRNSQIFQHFIGVKWEATGEFWLEDRHDPT